MTNIDAIVAHYVSLRDQKAEIEARQREELAPINRDMELIEKALLKLMQAQGVESVRTPSGTPYIAKHTSCKVQDWDALLSYIRENDEWDLLERRVSKTAFLAGDAKAPGVFVTDTLAVNVRRS